MPTRTLVKLAKWRETVTTEIQSGVGVWYLKNYAVMQMPMSQKEGLFWLLWLALDIIAWSWYQSSSSSKQLAPAECRRSNSLDKLTTLFVERLRLGFEGPYPVYTTYTYTVDCTLLYSDFCWSLRLLWALQLHCCLLFNWLVGLGRRGSMWDRMGWIGYVLTRD